MFDCFLVSLLLRSRELFQLVLLLHSVALLRLVLLALLRLDQALGARCELLEGLDALRVLLRHDTKGPIQLGPAKSIQLRVQRPDNSASLGNQIVCRRDVVVPNRRGQIVSPLDLLLGLGANRIEFGLSVFRAEAGFATRFQVRGLLPTKPLRLLGSHPRGVRLRLIKSSGLLVLLRRLLWWLAGFVGA